MSWSIDDNMTIKITKNDTPTFYIDIHRKDPITGEEVPYTPEGDDAVVFAIKRNENDTHHAFAIAADNQTGSFTFPEGWADNLELGKYWYEVSLNNGTYHETFIENKRIVITMEIYGGEKQWRRY